MAILLTILLPSLGNAREKARITVCQSNLKQVNNSLQLYLKDNNNFYPNKIAGTGKHGWFGKMGYANNADKLLPKNRPLNKYFGRSFADDAEVLVAKCPGDKKFYDKKGSSYKINTDKTWNSLHDKDIYSVQIMKVSSPEKMVVVSEWGFMQYIRGNITSINDFHETVRNKTGIYNTIMADGRVLSVKFWPGRLNADSYVMERHK